jgi:hypothetical protein
LQLHLTSRKCSHTPAAAQQIDLGIADDQAPPRDGHHSNWEINQETKALHAMLGTRREAAARLADLKLCLLSHAPPGTRPPPSATNTMSADRAMAAILRG